MTIATIEVQPRVSSVDMTNSSLVVSMQDGRVVSVPFSWYPRLSHATLTERSDWRVFEDTDGRDVIFWEQLDELIPAVALLAGVPSRESKRSFDRWLSARKDASK
ncbi:MAG: DUF2442 domain-containing protein [Caldilineaceae bacterium]|nr:DUF2442 domain-containing protein [Caldilineaceae bacterium]